eukprot:sb/3468997/
MSQPVLLPSQKLGCAPSPGATYHHNLSPHPVPDLMDLVLIRPPESHHVVTSSHGNSDSVLAGKYRGSKQNHRDHEPGEKPHRSSRELTVCPFLYLERSPRKGDKDRRVSWYGGWWSVDSTLTPLFPSSSSPCSSKIATSPVEDALTKFPPHQLPPTMAAPWTVLFPCFWYEAARAGCEENSLFRSRDWSSANQGPVFLALYVQFNSTGIPIQVKTRMNSLVQEPTKTSKQPIITRYLCHVTG